MRGASGKTLAQVLTTVDELVAGGAEPHLLGNQLFEVVSVLDKQPALRRVLTDPSIEDERKADLARSVFGGQVTAATMDTIVAAVSGRWSSSRDFADGLEQAGVAAHVAGADKAGKLDDLEDDMFRFGRIVAGDSELRGALTDRTIPAEAKASLLDNLIKSKSSASGKALIAQALAARSGRFEPTLAGFGELAAARRQRMLATVRVAYALDESEKQRLTDALARKYGRDVHLNVIVDPSVVGGISVAIGAEVIDGTVSGKLEDARRRIAG